MWGGPTTLDKPVGGGVIYSWSVRARTMSLTECEFHQFKLSHGTLPSLSPLSTTSTHPHHSCTAVRPSFPGHSTHFSPMPRPLVRPPSSPSSTPLYHHNSPSPGVAFTFCTSLATFLATCSITHVPPRTIHICPHQRPQYRQRIWWCTCAHGFAPLHDPPHSGIVFNVCKVATPTPRFALACGIPASLSPSSVTSHPSPPYTCRPSNLTCLLIRDMMPTTLITHLGATSLSSGQATGTGAR